MSNRRRTQRKGNARRYRNYKKEPEMSPVYTGHHLHRGEPFECKACGRMVTERTFVCFSSSHMGWIHYYCIETKPKEDVA